MQASRFDIHGQDCARGPAPGDFATAIGDFATASVEDSDGPIVTPRGHGYTRVTAKVAEARRVFEDRHAEAVALFEDHMNGSDIGRTRLSCGGDGEHTGAAPEGADFVGGELPPRDVERRSDGGAGAGSAGLQEFFERHWWGSLRGVACGLEWANLT